MAAIFHIFLFEVLAKVAEKIGVSRGENVFREICSNMVAIDGPEIGVNEGIDRYNARYACTIWTRPI